MGSPSIDARTEKDIIETLRRLAPHYVPEWRFTPDNPDPGSALVLLFAKMIAGNIRRFNRLPDKHFVAFLNLLGVNLLPARPAMSYVVFDVNKGMDAAVSVPKGSQLTATVESEEEDVSFETVHPLRLSSAQLQAMVCSHGWDDAIQVAYTTDDEEENSASGLIRCFDFTREGNLQQHALYLAHPFLLILDGPAQVELTIEYSLARSIETVVCQRLADRDLVEWSYYTENGWLPFSDVTVFNNQLLLGKAETIPLAASEQFSEENQWLRCVARQGKISKLLADLEQFTGNGLKMRVRPIFPSDVWGRVPDWVIQGESNVDVTVFQPFGKYFVLENTCYISSREVLSKRGAQIHMRFDLELMNNTYGDSADSDINWKLIMKESDFRKVRVPQLYVRQVAWEYWNGRSWVPLPLKSGESVLFATDARREVNVKFVLPFDMEPTAVDSDVNYWIRWRVVDMDTNYGAYMIYHTPQVENLRFDYEYDEANLHPRRVVAENNLSFVDATQSVSSGKSPVPWFTPLDEAAPSIYLAFDEPLQGGPLGLYLSLASSPVEPGSLKLEWSYLTRILGEWRWESLVVSDDTDGLSRSGAVRFAISHEMVSDVRFGKYGSWLRCTLRGHQGPAPQFELKVIRLNAVKVVQQATVLEEVPEVFFRDGRTGFQLEHHSILDEQVWIDETDTLTAEEQSALADNPEMAQVIRNQDNHIIRIWVRWSRVEHLMASGPADRHYVVDRYKGRIYFGDGRRGKALPSEEPDLIKLTYRYGGGSAGNVAAGQIDTLTTALAFVNGVVNPDSAIGGSDFESMGNALERGPHMAQHGSRALTSADFEWMALGANSNIAKIRCLTNRNAALQHEAGSVLLVVFPKAGGEQAFLEISRDIRRHLEDKIPNVMFGPRKWNIILPVILEVSVQVQLLTTDLDKTLEIESEAHRRLRSYLNPVTGNHHGKGFAIGEAVHPSAFLGLLKSIAGVESVQQVMMAIETVDNGQRRELSWQQAALLSHSLVTSGQHGVTVTVVQEED